MGRCRVWGRGKVIGIAKGIARGKAKTKYEIEVKGNYSHRSRVKV